MTHGPFLMDKVGILVLSLGGGNGSGQQAQGGWEVGEKLVKAGEVDCEHYHSRDTACPVPYLLSPNPMCGRFVAQPQGMPFTPGGGFYSRGCLVQGCTVTDSSTSACQIHGK